MSPKRFTMAITQRYSLQFRADPLRFSRMGLWMSDCRFTQRILLNIHCSGVFTPLPCCYMAGATWNCCRHVLCTLQNHAPVYSVILFEAIYVGCMCVSAGTRHLHFWQNGRGVLCVTAITRRWNGYRTRSKHRKFTLKKCTITCIISKRQKCAQQSSGP